MWLESVNHETVFPSLDGQSRSLWFHFHNNVRELVTGWAMRGCVDFWSQSSLQLQTIWIWKFCLNFQGLRFTSQKWGLQSQSYLTILLKRTSWREIPGLMINRYWVNSQEMLALCHVLYFLGETDINYLHFFKTNWWSSFGLMQCISLIENSFHTNILMCLSFVPQTTQREEGFLWPCVLLLLWIIVWTQLFFTKQGLRIQGTNHPRGVRTGKFC